MKKSETADLQRHSPALPPAPNAAQSSKRACAHMKKNGKVLRQIHRRKTKNKRYVLLKTVPFSKIGTPQKSCLVHGTPSCRTTFQIAKDAPCHSGRAHPMSMRERVSILNRACAECAGAVIISLFDLAKRRSPIRPYARAPRLPRRTQRSCRRRYVRCTVLCAPFR